MHLSLTPTALAKAKALGVVAAALTAGGAGGMLALSQVSRTPAPTSIVTTTDASTPPSSDPAESASPTPTATQSTRKPAKPAPTTTGSYPLPSCPADVKNRGAYVSGVAHSAPKGKDGEHGTWVSQAAQSDCGKSTHASEQPEPAESDSPDAHDGESHSAGPHSAGPVHNHGSTSQKNKDGHGGH